jgi:hypothetical protein
MGRDLVGGRIEEEEGEVMLGDADIGFITGGGMAEGSFVAEVEEVAVVGRGLSIVEDGLVAEAHAEDLAQDESGFASGEGKGDVEGQDQPQQIGRAMNAGQVDGGRFGSGRGQLGRGEMIFPILVAELELGEAQLLQKPFAGAEGPELLEVMGAAVAGALVEGAVGTLFPAVERAVAVRASRQRIQQVSSLKTENL